MSQLTTFRDDLAGLVRLDRLRALRPRCGADFSSNDYLALSGSPRLRQAVFDALERGLSVGSGGSRLLRGNDPEHELLEAEAAAFFGAERALFFSSGYAANGALFATLPQRGDIVLHDALVHASAHDGMRLGRAETFSVRHNDAGAFEDGINAWRKRGGTGRPWLAVESLDSMDGDRAPLRDLAEVARRHDAFLLVDEAHATGVFGRDGRGLAEELDGRENVIALHTCGKALGCEGAILCLPVVLRDFLVDRGRPFVFSTAASPIVAAAVREALRCLADEPKRRASLWRLLAHAEGALSACGVSSTGSHILPMIVGDDGSALRMATSIQAAGFHVRAIRPPTVPQGTARLRISINLNVAPAQIEALAEAISAARP